MVTFRITSFSSLVNFLIPFSVFFTPMITNFFS